MYSEGALWNLITKCQLQIGANYSEFKHFLTLCCCVVLKLQLRFDIKKRVKFYVCFVLLEHIERTNKIQSIVRLNEYLFTLSLVFSSANTDSTAAAWTEFIVQLERFTQGLVDSQILLALPIISWIRSGLFCIWNLLLFFTSNSRRWVSAEWKDRIGVR